MNQSILFNDDLVFDKSKGVWRFSGLLAGQLVTIFIYSVELSRLSTIDNCTKYDLEEVTELWLEKNDPDNNEIHIKLS